MNHFKLYVQKHVEIRLFCNKKHEAFINELKRSGYPPHTQIFFSGCLKILAKLSGPSVFDLSYQEVLWVIPYLCLQSNV